MTKEETISKKVAKSLKPIHTKTNEKKVFKCLISALRNQGVDVFDVEKIIIGVYENLPSHEVELSEIVKLNEDIYLEAVKTNSGLNSLKKLIAKEYDNQTAIFAVKAIRDAINPNGNVRRYRYEISTGKEIVMDSKTSEVYQESTTTYKGEERLSIDRILSCYPVEIKINNNPLMILSVFDSDRGIIFDTCLRKYNLISILYLGILNYAKSNSQSLFSTVKSKVIMNKLYDNRLAISGKYLQQLFGT